MNTISENCAFFGTIYFPVAAAVVTGKNVKVVNVDGGTYRQAKNKDWVEQNEQGENIASFQEINRDDWSVYLQDNTRNINIQLDLPTGKVMSSVGNDPKVPLHNIRKVS